MLTIKIVFNSLKKPPPSLFIDMTQADRNDNDKEARQVELRLSKVGQAQGLDLSSLNL